MGQSNPVRVGRHGPAVRQDHGVGEDKVAGPQARIEAAGEAEAHKRDHARGDQAFRLVARAQRVGAGANDDRIGSPVGKQTAQQPSLGRETGEDANAH
jgi:hypothetical protein